MRWGYSIDQDGRVVSASRGLAEALAGANQIEGVWIPGWCRQPDGTAFPDTPEAIHEQLRVFSRVRSTRIPVPFIVQGPGGSVWVRKCTVKPGPGGTLTVELRGDVMGAPKLILAGGEPSLLASLDEYHALRRAANRRDHKRERADIERMLTALGWATPGVVTHKGLVTYLADLADAGKTAKTRANMLLRLRGFCRWLVRTGVIDADPTDGINFRTEEPEENARALTWDEATRLIRAVEARERNDARVQSAGRGTTGPCSWLASARPSATV